MRSLKRFMLKHFESTIVLSVFLGTLLTNYWVLPKACFLHFYYLPVLAAGLILGLKAALLASALSVAFVVLFTLLGHNLVAIGTSSFEIGLGVFLWGSFLILTSCAIGILWQRNAQKMQALRQAYVGVLEILSKYIESNDRYTMGHSIRVSHLAADTAEQMGLSETRIENCRVAGLLHDIGKVEISMDVIRKASTLTREEVEVVAAHAQRGARMIDSLGGILRDVVTIIEHHHTYFQDRHQQEVPQEAYILAVADAYDAIVTDRPYRSGKPPYQAIEELERGSGNQFSPEVVEAFKRVIARRMENLEAVTPPPHSGHDSGFGKLPETPAPKRPEQSPQPASLTGAPPDTPLSGFASSRQ